MAASPLIQIVDDDGAVRDALGRLLTAEGFAVRLHASAEAFLARRPAEPLHCIVTDLHMPGMDGLEMVRRLRGDGVAVPVILVTGRTHAALPKQVLAELACELIEKPFGPDEMVEAVRRALQSA